MKAVQIKSYGGSEVLEINDVAKPTVGKGQLLVKVYAASINPVDWKLRAGYLQKWMPVKFPATLGGDFAGVVNDVGEGVPEFKTGDQIYGSSIILGGGSGAFAQFTVANTANICLKPKSVNFEEAAALPLVGVSAIQALEEHIKLKSGDKILIHGGAGGIGHVAIQLAKALGAYVATTVGTNDIQFVKNLGTDEVIDYKKQSFVEIHKNYDAVFDTVGGGTTDKSFQVLKRRGIIVSMMGQPNADLTKKYEVTAIGQGTNINTTSLTRLTELVDSGKIKVNIAKIFPLEQIKEAFDYQQNYSPRGKVVLKIRLELLRN